MVDQHAVDLRRPQSLERSGERRERGLSVTRRYRIFGDRRQLGDDAQSMSGGRCRPISISASA